MKMKINYCSECYAETKNKNLCDSCLDEKAFGITNYKPTQAFPIDPKYKYEMTDYKKLFDPKKEGKTWDWVKKSK